MDGQASYQDWQGSGRGFPRVVVVAVVVGRRRDGCSRDSGYCAGMIWTLCGEETDRLESILIRPALTARNPAK